MLQIEDGRIFGTIAFQAAACGLTGLASLFIFGALLPTVIVPHLFSGLNADELRPVFAMAIAMLWTMAFTAALGAVAYGLEEAARRHQMCHA